MNKKNTRDGVTILHNRFIKGDIQRSVSLEAEREKIKIAEQIYNLRKERGLTQKQLASLMGTTQSVISRLEDTDYENQRVDTLQKIASALNCYLEVNFVPKDIITKSGENQDEKGISEIGIIHGQNSKIPVTEGQKHDLKNLIYKGLNYSEKLIVVLYYFENMTMKEIGATLNLSESRVSQMHSSILARLKAQIDIRDKEYITSK